MATQQFINAPRLFPRITNPSEVTFHVEPPRIDVGITPQTRSISEYGWALVAAAVRFYRTLPPEGRATVSAAFIAAGVSVTLGIGFLIGTL